MVTSVAPQMIELAHNPNTVQEVMRNQNCGLTGTDRERAPGGSLRKTKINSQGRQFSPRRAKVLTHTQTHMNTHTY